MKIEELLSLHIPYTHTHTHTLDRDFEIVWTEIVTSSHDWVAKSLVVELVPSHVQSAWESKGEKSSNCKISNIL